MNKWRICGCRTGGLHEYLLVSVFLAGCASGPAAKVHYTLEQDPASRPLQRVVLLPVDVDVYELSAGGVKEEVPEWSRSAEANIRSALLVSRGGGGNCCVTEPADISRLTPEERELLEEHLALFNTVIANVLSCGNCGPQWFQRASAF